MMFNLKDAAINEVVVVKEIEGMEQQIEYLLNVGIKVGREIEVIGQGKLPDSLLVKVGEYILHLNRDAVSRIMVEEKSKELAKKM